ncbi:MAG: ABC transporter permease [Isosphaeraceae bacterium]
MSRMHSLRELYFSRLREFYRQPARIFWVYGFPTIVAVCLGLAFQSRPPDAVQVDLIANEHSAAIEMALRDHDSRAASSRDQARILLQVGSRETAMRRLVTCKTPLVVEARGGQPVVYHFDPTRPDAGIARATVDDIIQEASGRRNPVATADEKVVEPGSRYIDFLIPGLIGVNTMGGGLWGIGFLLVNFRIGKLLKRFVATPMPRRNFLLSLLGARLTFLVPDVAVLLGLGHFGFGMPIRGSLFLAIFVVVVGALAFAGIGLLVGSRAQTTETVSGLMNLVMLPMWLLSGVFFSSDRFPAAIQPLIQALPLTQLLNALRGILLEGAGFLAVLPAILILAAWAVLTFLVALRIFRWT